MTIYDIPVLHQDGTEGTLKPYEGQVLLIVNTATHCGFTPQYEGLQELYDRYESRGFQVLDFPCNQFGEQAPGTAEEIQDFCTLHYATSFPRFGKIDVNGENEAPLFHFLKQEKGGLMGEAIKWNFTKFLIDRQGQVVKRYAPMTTPDAIKKDIEVLL